jgi:hypothetical protein
MALSSDFKSRASQASQVSAQAQETAAPAVLNEFREMVTAGYNWLTRAVRSEEVSPITEQYTPAMTFVSTSNLTAGQTLYYPSSAGASVGSQKDICTQLFLSSSSGSIFCYFQGTNDPGAAPRWADITQKAISYSPYADSYSTFSVATGTADWFVSLENLNVDKWRVVAVIDYSNVNQLCIYTRTKSI